MDFAVGYLENTFSLQVWPFFAIGRMEEVQRFQTSQYAQAAQQNACSGLYTATGNSIWLTTSAISSRIACTSVKVSTLVNRPLKPLAPGKPFT